MAQMTSRLSERIDALAGVVGDEACECLIESMLDCLVGLAMSSRRLGSQKASITHVFSGRLNHQQMLVMHLTSLDPNSYDILSGEPRLSNG